jgi:hypothetical protein
VMALHVTKLTKKKQKQKQKQRYSKYLCLILIRFYFIYNIILQEKCVDIYILLQLPLGYDISLLSRVKFKILTVSRISPLKS